MAGKATTFRSRAERRVLEHCVVGASRNRTADPSSSLVRTGLRTAPDCVGATPDRTGLGLVPEHCYSRSLTGPKEGRVSPPTPLATSRLRGRGSDGAWCAVTHGGTDGREQGKHDGGSAAQGVSSRRSRACSGDRQGRDGRSTGPGRAGTNEASRRHRPAAAGGRRNPCRPCGRDGLARSHHPGSADALAPSGPRARQGQGRDRRDRLSDRRPWSHDAVPQGRVMDRADHFGGLEDEIAHLRGLDLEGLRARWRSLTGRAAPAQLPRALLLGALAYRVQAAALGDLDRASVRFLERLAAEDRSGERATVPIPASTSLRPGCELNREWEGTVQRVRVLADGYAWKGTTYKSLSQVARAITGTRWNGPRFFGLRDRKPGERS